MGGLRSFTRTRPGGETSSSSASRGNIGSRSCGRLRQTISRAKHQKRESDTKARCKGRGSPTRRRPYEYERPDDQPATTSGGPLEPESCCHVYSPRCHVGLLAAYRPTRSGQVPAPWLRSSARLRDRPWKLRGEPGPFRSLGRDWRCPRPPRCLLPTLNCSRVSMTRATRRPLTKVTTRSSISPSIRDEICE